MSAPGTLEPLKPEFFRTPSAFRRWLARHHTSTRELWVGFYKKGSGIPSITWPEAVDQALCFGWIDGIRKSFTADSYVIRFTPRNPKSIWSAVNTRRARELKKLGLMQPSGLKAFGARDPRRSTLYSFERARPGLPKAMEQQFRANRPAWEFYQSQPPGYRKTTSWWVVSAKQSATQQKRLTTLIADSEAGRRIAPLRRPERRSTKE